MGQYSSAQAGQYSLSQPVTPFWNWPRQIDHIGFRDRRGGFGRRQGFRDRLEVGQLLGLNRRGHWVRRDRRRGGFRAAGRYMTLDSGAGAGRVAAARRLGFGLVFASSFSGMVAASPLSITGPPSGVHERIWLMG